MRPRLSIALHGVSVRRGGKWVLRDVAWQLKPGERWALLGENGAGKTQLLKLLSGAVWPTPAASRNEEPAERAARTYRRGDAELPLIEAKQYMAYIGGELQDKYARYGWNLPVDELVATGLHGTDLLMNPITAQDAARVAKVLSRCGLRRYARREFLTLSYGEKRLALLARALVQNPDWLLLDEFYNGLDGDYRRRIDAVLDAARRRGQSWVATAHRAVDLPRGTRLVLSLAAGRVKSRERLGLARLRQLTQRAQEPLQVRNPLAQPRPGRRTLKGGAGPVLLELTDVDLYVEYRAVLERVNWRLRRGEHWAVFGANGAGKSSLLKLLYGDLAPALGGRIERAGCPPGTHISEWKRRVGLVSPELQTTYLVDVSVLELVASARYSSIGLVDEMTRADERHARRWLEFFELQPLALRRPRELSYGQLRRALIARALAADAEILLLDEPLTGLDPAQRAGMKRVLQRLMRQQVTVVAAVHHAEDLPQGITHALHLHNRRATSTDF
jgi:molybdate transport system ATP-binding protein